MKPSLTETLCTRCGLCCDGSLFADVELASDDETSSIEVMGMEVEDTDEGEGGLLLQPCRALNGKRCSIYPYRPECCRTFECRLLQEVKRGGVSFAEAETNIAQVQLRIKRVKELINQLGQVNAHLPLKERCGEALELSEQDRADQEMNRKRDDLETAMTTVETLIQETFLNRR